MTAPDWSSAVAELARRPGHEKVRALCHRLLVEGLGVASGDIDFEKPAPEVRGRIDALLGRTVFEFKSDLRRERRDAEAGLARYLAQREERTGDRYVGIAADGADFVAFFRRGGAVVEAGSCRADPEAPRDLLAWLQGAVAVGEGLPPDPGTVAREFGRGSLTALRALEDLAALWARAGGTPAARLKRALWGRLLGLAYGADVGDDALFLQHTYLVVVAKALAWRAARDGPPTSAAGLLHGAAFGGAGQADPDFFDWVLAAEGGEDLVLRTARQAARFRLQDIRSDILKALYESLIDPETRHDLGEYYTPDWLAARIVAAAVDDPLERRAMDPACGSGTFLFHAVRAVLAAAEAAGLPPAEAALRATANVAGIDIHPVAVIFARVTYLLALAPALREGAPGGLALPVYLGDALQWNLARPGEKKDEPDLLAHDDVLEISVPAVTLAEPKPRRLAPAVLRFPAVAVSDAALFDRAVSAMIDAGARSEPESGFGRWIRREIPAASSGDAAILRQTYLTMRRLQTEGRDHVWGYVARNLARPVWLSSEARKADVVIGNPPWVSYRYMSGAFQKRFREECRAARLWVGGKVATQQDLASYFYMRAALLYMRRTGRIALVMPFAAMSRQAYAEFRKGGVARFGRAAFRLRFTEAWAFGPEVQPLFPVPGCVLFAEAHKGAAPAPLPERVAAFAGALPRRDADAAEANASLTEAEAPWPAEASVPRESPYRRAFRNGATLVPRRLALVEIVPPPRLTPGDPLRPVVRGSAGRLDKAPWADVEPPMREVDAAFLRPALLGESVAPFRLLAPRLAVIPWDPEENELIDAKAAMNRGYRNLMHWLERAEELWESRKRSPMSFVERLDYYGKLTRQFPIAPIRVVYTASGTYLAAAAVRDDRAVVENKLYWAAAANMNEANYLCGVLNSEVLRASVAPWQSQGQWGARDFHKYVFNVSIPRFDGEDPLHARIAQHAAVAEEVASRTPPKEGEHFTRTRRRIRAALAEHGVGRELESLAGELLSLDTGAA